MAAQVKLCELIAQHYTFTALSAYSARSFIRALFLL